jgi:hypothetical protein
MIKYEGRYAESDIPSTSDEWELFTSTMSCGHAARALTAAMKRALKRFERVAPKEGPTKAFSAAYSEWLETAYKYSDVGASDTEPRWVAQDAIQRFAVAAGYSEDALHRW